MPVPYTMEAVAALCHAERTGTSAQEIQRHFGWDAAMLARVCQRHGIGLVVSAPSVAPPAPSREPLPPIAPYPANIVRIISKLSTRQAEIFRILRERQMNGGGTMTGSHLAEKITGAGARSMNMSTASLARRLERMDCIYRIESKMGPGGGCRLVLRDAAR